MFESASGSDDQDFTSRADIAKDQWGNIIRVQIHFNEIIHRTLQLTATLVLASYGAAAAFFTSHPGAFILYNMKRIHITGALILLGFIFLVVGCVTDRFYYFKLLLASVQTGEEIENKYNLPAKLTVALSKAVDRGHATLTAFLFYGAGIVVGVLLLWFVNGASVVGL